MLLLQAYSSHFFIFSLQNIIPGQNITTSDIRKSSYIPYRTVYKAILNIHTILLLFRFLFFIFGNSQAQLIVPLLTKSANQRLAEKLINFYPLFST